MYGSEAQEHKTRGIERERVYGSEDEYKSRGREREYGSEEHRSINTRENQG